MWNMTYDPERSPEWLYKYRIYLLLLNIYSIAFYLVKANFIKSYWIYIYLMKASERDKNLATVKLATEWSKRLYELGANAAYW